MDERARVLIVDDEPFNIDYLEQELEDLDCETASAGNGREALELVAADAPDLILLDIMMPQMDGFQVLAQLKSDQALRDIPVIVISALDDMGSVVKGIEMGADDYLPKPFDPVLLKARMSACLEKKRLRDREVQYLRRINEELDLAWRVQSGFLPDDVPQLPGW
ncbi:MAG: response regulator, partial [Anaerolineales bacterium]